MWVEGVGRKASEGNGQREGREREIEEGKGKLKGGEGGGWRSMEGQVCNRDSS